MSGTKDIDVVVTWVNSRCPQWQELYERTVGVPFKTSERFTISDDPECELSVCLSLIRKNMKWVRKTFVLTIDGQVPDCLENEIVVHHSEIGLSPVFNSHAIESRLHYIPGLSEHFIYVNDDLFVRRKLKPCHFFRDGMPIVRLGWHPYVLTKLFYKEWIDNLNETATKLGVETDMALHHVLHPLTKKIMQDAEVHFGEEWSSTSTCKIRHRCGKEIAPIYSSLRLAIRNEQATQKEHEPFVLHHINVSDRTFTLFKVLVPTVDIVCMSGYSGSRKELQDYLNIKNKYGLRLWYCVVVAVIVAAIIAKVIARKK